MVVVIVADVLGKENNGTTVACMNLVRYLRGNGDTVRIVCCDADRKNDEGCYVVPTLNLGPILNGIVKRNEVSLSKPDRKTVEAALEGADAVHIMVPFALGRQALKVARGMGIPVTAGFHCQAENLTSHLLLMNSRLATRLTYRVFYRRFYSKVDAIHYPTAFIRDVFEQSVGHTTRAFVISNGVNDRFVRTEAEKPAELRDRFVILFIGRYSREKSHGVLIRAVSRSKYRDRIQLIFAGAGPRRGRIRKLSDKCHILPPVMKFFSRDELVRVINYSDLYCHPAEIELEGIACLEALRCGLVPVIADSKRCATKGLAITPESLFRCNDPDDLAKKIDFWIEHGQEKERLRDAYIRRTDKYDQTRCMESMRDMFEQVISEKGAKADEKESSPLQ